MGIFGNEIKLMKSVVSLMYDGSDFMIGCSQKSTNLDIISVKLFILDTIGLIPIGFLCITYSWEVVCSLGGLQKSIISSFDFSILSRNSKIFFLVRVVRSCDNFLYTFGLFKCSRPSATYVSLSWTTIVELLSALLITVVSLFFRLERAFLFLLIMFSFCILWRALMNGSRSLAISLTN